MTGNQFILLATANKLCSVVCPTSHDGIGYSQAHHELKIQIFFIKQNQKAYQSKLQQIRQPSPEKLTLS